MSPPDVEDALAYVDGCLPAEAAAAFESRLPGDPALRARVDLWRRQNAALKSAFDGRRKTGRSPVVLRQVANVNRDGMPTPLRPFPRSAPQGGAVAKARAWRLVGVFALALVFLVFGSALRRDPAPMLAARAQMAFDARRQEPPAESAEALQGGGFRLQRTPADAPEGFAPELVAVGDRSVVVWCDGRAYFALAGDGDATAMKAEAARLLRQTGAAP